MNIKLVGEVPFSCCNIRTIFPCIHHGIESGINDYKYDVLQNFSINMDGCWSVMERRKTKSGLSVAGYLFGQLVLLVSIFINQVNHFFITNFLDYWFYTVAITANREQ